MAIGLASGDKLTPAEQLELKKMAVSLLPTLPQGDQTLLNAWIDKLDQYPVDKTTHMPIFPTHVNPYMQPSVTAMLAQVLGELAHIMSEIMLQSAKLEVNLMMASLQNAQAAKDATIAAGNASANSLEQDAKDHYVKMAGAIAQCAITCVSTAVSAEASYETKKRLRNDPGFAGMTASEKLRTESSSTTEITQQISQMGQIATQATTAATEGISAGIAVKKAALERERAIQDAASRFMDKMGESLSQGASKASQSIDEASKAWQSIMELLKDMSRTARGIGGRG